MVPAHQTVLEVRDLCVEFRADGRIARAVDGVSWSVPRGRTLAVVGESGCGKSATALAVMRLLPTPPARVVRGSVLLRYDEQAKPLDLLAAGEAAVRRIRGRRMGMIFQDPMTALNPVLTVGHQIGEVLAVHLGLRRREARDAVTELLARVGMTPPAERAAAYPHQLSGGMRQRVMIAMAVACRPAVLIADEPSTALDVTIQAQILDLLLAMQAETGMSMVLVTHDLGVVAEVADEVCVMYAGRIVERAPVRSLLGHPLHPYTQALLRCVPRLTDEPTRFEPLPGRVPHPARLPTGCRFHPRCPRAVPQCSRPEGDPPLRELRLGHHVACGEVRD